MNKDFDVVLVLMCVFIYVGLCMYVCVMRQYEYACLTMDDCKFRSLKLIKEGYKESQNRIEDIEDEEISLRGCMSFGVKREGKRCFPRS